MKYDGKSDRNFDIFIDTLLNKDVAKEPLPKQESFDKFIERVSGKSDKK